MAKEQIEKLVKFAQKECDKFEGRMRSKGIGVDVILWHPFEREGVVFYTGTSESTAIAKTLGCLPEMFCMLPNPLPVFDATIKILQDERQKLLDTSNETTHTDKHGNSPEAKGE